MVLAVAIAGMTTFWEGVLKSKPYFLIPSRTTIIDHGLTATHFARSALLNDEQKAYVRKKRLTALQLPMLTATNPGISDTSPLCSTDISSESHSCKQLKVMLSKSEQSRDVEKVMVESATGSNTIVFGELVQGKLAIFPEQLPMPVATYNQGFQPVSTAVIFLDDSDDEFKDSLQWFVVFI